MKRRIPWILAAMFAFWALSGVRPPKPKDGFDFAAFGRLPVQANGRIQPMDTVARNTLLGMSGKSTVRTDKGRLTATEWMLEAMTRPADADTRKVFRVQHPDLEGLLGSEKIGLEYHAYNDLTNHLATLDAQMKTLREADRAAGGAARERTLFQKDLLHLYGSVSRYQRLKNTLMPEGAGDFAAEIRLYEEKLRPGMAALRAREAGESSNTDDLQALMVFFKRYQRISTDSELKPLPPLTRGTNGVVWNDVGTALLSAMRSGEIPPAAKSLAAIVSASAQRQPAEFNQAVADYKNWLAQNGFERETDRGRREFLFHQMDAFSKAMAVYVAALVLGCLFWINLAEWLRRSAFALLTLAFVLHTFGLVFRMVVEGRPPVTNLYSSAVFVGWGAVLLGIYLERAFRGGIGLVTSALTGFVTLIIAHHLSLGGDTMETLRAVLDTNFWLTTHVVTITLGYSSMFIAGLLAVIYILRGVLTRTLTPELAQALARMVYGITCFALFFNFVGTVLGGIWADQSWGRFWGWDPKENGALMIVLWNAAFLHARRCGLAGERGLMVMAVAGNIITSFSWFGVNMLGVGLHSYGFMDSAFKWLAVFMGSQAVIIGLALLPKEMWRSFKQP